MTKTNVMRLFEQNKINYTSHEWEKIDEVDTSQAPIYKTLVTYGKSGNNYVFVVPVDAELDLKKAAKAANEKSIHMLKEKDLEPLTGYVHGGCSPIGMKKQLDTIFDESAINNETILFSAGKIGFSVEMDPRDIQYIIPVDFVDVKTEN